MSFFQACDHLGDKKMPCRLFPDVWLGERLGKKVWRLELGTELAAPDLHELLADPGPEALVYCKVAAHDMGLVHLLEQTGFRLVDASLTLERSNDAEANGSEAVRWAVAADCGPVMETARANFSFSRFHQDPLIPGKIADDLKAEWAGNFFRGRRGDAMVVAEQHGRVAGFLQLLQSSKALVIDLLAVDRQARGSGLAEAMIRFAGSHFPLCDVLRVGTQAANIPAARLYEKLGFRLRQAHYVFHLHISENLTPCGRR